MHNSLTQTKVKHTIIHYPNFNKVRNEFHFSGNYLYSVSNKSNIRQRASAHDNGNVS